MSLSLVPFKQGFSTFLVTSAHADISLCVSVRMQVNSLVLLVKHKFYCHINVSNAFWSQNGQREQKVVPAEGTSPHHFYNQQISHLLDQH